MFGYSTIDLVAGAGIPPATQPKQEVAALTKNSITLNRTLFLEDNLPVLRGLDSDSIDLIATDPPFNKGVHAFTGTTKAGENVEFNDVWHWGDVQDGWPDEIEENHPQLFNVIRYASAAAGDDMGAFLCWMAVRVLEMHRVLKPTGSIYLHCDSTSSHYLKAMMDAIFGRKNFRNEIVWRIGWVSGFKTQKRGWIRNHDTILYYLKSPGAASSFNKEYLPYPKGYVRRDGKRPTGKGIPLEDTWSCSSSDVLDSIMIKSFSQEKTGYPTQKPLALYERIIKASSNPGDMVLDPFAGCATTCVAAEQLGRRWIGIDIREESGGVIRERLEREVSENTAWDALVRTPTEAPKRTDVGEAAAPELILVSQKRVGRRIQICEVREELIVKDGQRCQGCGWEPQWPDYLQVDYKRPRTLGGKDEMDNYALLCDPCNRKKSNRLTLTKLRQARASEGRMDTDWYEEVKW